MFKTFVVIDYKFYNKKENYLILKILKEGLNQKIKVGLNLKNCNFAIDIFLKTLKIKL